MHSQNYRKQKDEQKAHYNAEKSKYFSENHPSVKPKPHPQNVNEEPLKGTGKIKKGDKLGVGWGP